MQSQESQLAWIAKRTIAIYHQQDGGHPRQWGSGVLLRVADVGFVISAAHVLNTDDNTGIVLAPMEGRSPFLSGDLNIARTTDEEFLDFGIARMTADVTHALSTTKKFISLAEVLCAPLPRSAPYAVFGYPISTTKTNITAKRVDLDPFFYLGTISEPAAGLPEWRIMMPCNHTLFKRVDDIPSRENWETAPAAKMPYLQGISGCGIWMVDPTRRTTPVLAGIDHHTTESRSQIIGTAARGIPRMIARHNSDLRASIKLTCPEIDIP